MVCEKFARFAISDFLFVCLRTCSLSVLHRPDLGSIWHLHHARPWTLKDMEVEFSRRYVKARHAQEGFYRIFKELGHLGVSAEEVSAGLVGVIMWRSNLCARYRPVIICQTTRGRKGKRACWTLLYGRHVDLMTHPQPLTGLLMMLTQTADGFSYHHQLYHQFDVDGSDNVTMDEVRRGLNRIFKRPFTKIECEQIFRMLDEDGSGGISLDEWVERFRKQAWAAVRGVGTKAEIQSLQAGLEGAHTVAVVADTSKTVTKKNSKAQSAWLKGTPSGTMTKAEDAVNAIEAYRRYVKLHRTVHKSEF